MEVYKEFCNYLKELSHLENVNNLLIWDQSTYMPSANASYRGQQSAFISKLAHEKWISPKLGEMLAKLQPWATSMGSDSVENRLVFLVAKEYKKARKVPATFIEKCSAHTSRTYQAWLEAREKNDFSLVAPLLKTSLDLSLEYATFFPGYKHVADPLIDSVDEGMTVEVLRPLFQQLRKELISIVEHISHSEQVDQSCLHQHFPKQKQLQFIEVVLDQVGMNWNRCRQDFSPHPFMTRLGTNDVRITTRINERELTEGFTGSMHETGHAFYELGMSPELFGTPLLNGVSSGVHESQSRLWENLVAKSHAFWEFFYPKLQSIFPTQLGSVPMETFYRAIHHVSPSLIRTESDEVTYNLHIIIRFDLELDLLTGRLRVEDLPEAWRERYRKDLGIEVPDDKHGVLQDMHWFIELLGGQFQCYTLGNILSTQFFSAATKEHSAILDEMSDGKFDNLHGWLQQNIYQHGRKYSTEEIIQRATGKSFSIEPYLEYLKNKYQTIYG